MKLTLADELYNRGLAWIIYHRGGHNGRWPPTSVPHCMGWGCVRQLAFIHDMSAREVAADLVDYAEHSEKGFPQP
jgi:hypothetical protein